MACHAVQMWSLSGLVAAFLDLTIAYFLLCASAAAYLASKFLAFFGLNLPCPCDGMFINVHTKSLCFNRLLVDFPIEKLSDVQLSVKQKFPFARSMSPKRYDGIVVGDNCGNGVIELEGEASCSSSISDARESADVFGREMITRNGKIDMKGKGILSYRPKSRLRHRKGIRVHGKNFSLLSYNSPVHEEVTDSQDDDHFSSNKRGSWCTRDSSLPSDDDGNHYLEYNKAKKLRARGRTLSRDEMNLSPEEDMCIKESMGSGEDLQYNQQGVQSGAEDDNDKIRHLEQALERERAARAALYTELEKERSAAASAADEAMAMILRLQADKASIEMEARQYQRIIEEKSAYDDEEMEILQEILMRREREKLFLEKEVESYREMVSRGSEQLTGVCSDNRDARLVAFDPLDDPTDTESKYTDDDFLSKFSYKPSLGIESAFQPHDEQSSFGRLDNSTPWDMKELEQAPEMNEGHKLTEKVIRTCYGTEKGDLSNDPSSKQKVKDAPLGDSNSCDPAQDEVPRIYDVHIVGDGINLPSETTADKGEQLPVSSSEKVRKTGSVQPGAARERINITNDHPSDPLVKKSSSEVTFSLPPIARRGSAHSLRRNSMSALDSEMLKIDSEIIQLKERLKRVQEGRGKLSSSLENRETKNVQLNILEDIARQIQEIRRFSKPQKTARHASLPLPDSKGLSKRRRSRSMSSGFLLSSEG